MSGPAELDLTVWRNARWPDDLFIPCDATTEEPMDLASLGTIQFQIRLYDGAAGSSLLTATVANGKIVTADGGFRITLTQADLESLPAAGKVGAPAHFRHDLKLGSDVYVFGDLKVMPGVTR